MSEHETDACPCGSKKKYDECCGPLHAGTKFADTAENLMRSRFAAFAKNDFNYLGVTLHESVENEHDTPENRELYKQFEWNSLEILETEKGQVGDEDGYVDFVARYDVAGTPHAIREKSFFVKQDGKWLYFSGKSLKVPTDSQEKVGRNDPCPCGSGKKYKKCCMN